MIPTSHVTRYASEDDSPLLSNIKHLQAQLVQAVDEHKSFTAHPVVQLSQELDRYILQFQKHACERR
ncbi:aspartyl-phosphate phosphatase Spo0E family protein [Paenibacillus sp. 481]|uniref:aspartyl-phosphate phosphatase Spo0E family protein n=1 Tax=Paenibacillus sp. 481 TaxID=2835869 RepID=UPI001E5558DF|nr:aspartyl-phosphate phosphatase Spo0E family protein [Paenibacillus sp. 481]UHA73770.1 aspartyl-phosphate phosphatase Spo0E family protein [Paenibacillus sp. 481]